MESSVLSKDYIIENGIDFDDLWSEYCSDRMLDNPEDESGKPFTGITYELFPNGDLNYYSYYVDGFSHGIYLKFYTGGNIKSKQHIKYGVVNGIEETWFDNGQKKSIAKYDNGICLNLKEWNIDNEMAVTKKEPTEQDLKMLSNKKKWNKSIGRE